MDNNIIIYHYSYHHTSSTYTRPAAHIQSPSFHSSLIQIHEDSLHFSIIFTSGSIMLQFSHDVPFIESKLGIYIYIYMHTLYT